ncbi:hypothetical protein C1645_760165 [Glomus cerebriforme]|uniref:Membrane anchor Opy2 N-terminal domain-containing protein n=1 Tax=Glomus cerebriforme TaxID=658196 RepID=A0A397THF1_9GLOM|nr:hypothetical protein C1645_760165 [Glomus cerebriforme]
MLKSYIGYLICIIFFSIRICNAGVACIQCLTYPTCHDCASGEMCVVVKPDCHSCGSANCVKKR